MSRVREEELLTLCEEENYVIDLINNNPHNKESFVVSLVSQSRHLLLIKDGSILHLRLDPKLEAEEYARDQKLAEYLLDLYPMLFDENLSSERSGDLNRIFIAQGTNFYQ